VRTLREALDAAAEEESGAIAEIDHPKWGRLREVNTPIRFSGQARSRHEPAPALGAHTESVLRGCLSYDEDRIAELRQQGVI
jgi:crotonobetainyl-CoA:carnitine CoA-transferase CaiB-like acyl-CoA transferase